MPDIRHLLDFLFSALEFYTTAFKTVFSCRVLFSLHLRVLMGASRHVFASMKIS